MRCILSLIVLLIPALASSAPDITRDLKDDHKREIERLVGTWKVVSMVLSGMDRDIVQGEEMELTITEDKMTPKRNGNVEENHAMKYTIDIAKNPKHIDLKPVEAMNGQPELFKAVYQLKEDELVIVMGMEISNPGESKRPAGLDAKGEGNAMVIRMTLKRVKK